MQAAKARKAHPWQRVENIEDPHMRGIRYLDKLIDEPAKGKAMERGGKPAHSKALFQYHENTARDQNHRLNR